MSKLHPWRHWTCLRSRCWCGTSEPGSKVTDLEGCAMMNFLKRRSQKQLLNTIGNWHFIGTSLLAVFRAATSLFFPPPRRNSRATEAWKHRVKNLDKEERSHSCRLESPSHCSEVQRTFSGWLPFGFTSLPLTKSSNFSSFQMLSCAHVHLVRRRHHPNSQTTTAGHFRGVKAYMRPWLLLASKNRVMLRMQVSVLHLHWGRTSPSRAPTAAFTPCPPPLSSRVPDQQAVLYPSTHTQSIAKA